MSAKEQAKAISRAALAAMHSKDGKVSRPVKPQAAFKWSDGCVVAS